MVMKIVQDLIQIEYKGFTIEHRPFNDGNQFTVQFPNGKQVFKTLYQAKLNIGVYKNKQTSRVEEEL